MILTQTQFLCVTIADSLLTQPQVTLCVCEASASDASVIVGGGRQRRASAKRSSRWQEQRATPGRLGAPSRGKWLSSSWARGHRGSLPPIATVCTPRPVPSQQRTHTHTQVHTHLKLWHERELSDHRIPPHLRPDLGQKQTKKTKRALI